MTIKKLLHLLWRNRTKAFGFIQITVGYFAAAQGIFSKDTLELYVFVNGLLTLWLGFFNSSLSTTVTTSLEKTETVITPTESPKNDPE